MLKSYCNKIETVEHRGKTYIRSRCIDTLKPNTLTNRKQRILLHHFYDKENKQLKLDDEKFFSDVCKKMCVYQTTALHYLNSYASEQNWIQGSRSRKVIRKFRVNSIKYVIIIDTITGTKQKVKSANAAMKITGVSEASVYKSINDGRIIKNRYKFIARHYND